MENTVLPKLQFEAVKDNNDGIPAIIVAAGSSTRMGGINKQLLSLAGVPVIIRTLRAFERSGDVSRIILVTSEGLIPEMQLLCEKFSIGKLSDIVCGGADRQASVLCGIRMLGANEDRVLIHDGARPFVTEKMIAETAAALSEFEGALCAAKINDTVKLANGDNTVNKTLDRTYLYSAQTPQGVRVKEYLSALENISDTSVFTDDASILESEGYSVKIVQGSPQNIKITTPDDISLAESILLRGE